MRSSCKWHKLLISLQSTKQKTPPQLCRVDLVLANGPRFESSYHNTPSISNPIDVVFGPPVNDPVFFSKVKLFCKVIFLRGRGGELDMKNMWCGTSMNTTPRKINMTMETRKQTIFNRRYIFLQMGFVFHCHVFVRECHPHLIQSGLLTSIIPRCWQQWATPPLHPSRPPAPTVSHWPSATTSHQRLTTMVWHLTRIPVRSSGRPSKFIGSTM